MEGDFEMIYLLCSTIRPKIFKETHKYWMDNADSLEDITTKVVVDKKPHQTELAEFDTMLYIGDNVGLTNPLTQLTQSLEGLEDSDIIVVMSDDFFPPKHWDTLLYRWYINYTGALNVFDGGPPNVQKTLITIPIMDYATLKKLNKIVYHPAFSHMYSDNELYNNLVELDLMKTMDKNPDHIFEHKHWTSGKRPHDAQDITLYNLGKDSDRDIYLERKSMKFEDRIKYTPEVPIVLTILICTLTTRKDKLQNLMNILNPQLNANKNVNIFIGSDSGKLSIGAKRDILLKKATGKYVVFIDDDDVVSSDYVELILRAAEYGSDCIGMEGIITTDGINPKRFIHSIRNKKWEEVNGVYLRYPNHLNPIRTKLAKKVGFNRDLNNGEDKAYSDNVFPMLKSETYIGKSIYEYKFETQNKSYI